jgi:hypothetical protein
MKTGTALPLAAALLVTPLSAMADTIPHIEEFAYTFGGGAVGGFIGALLACWLCARRHRSDRPAGSTRG